MSPYRFSQKYYLIKCGDAPLNHAEYFYAESIEKAFELAKIRWPNSIPNYYACIISDDSKTFLKKETIVYEP